MPCLVCRQNQQHVAGVAKGAAVEKVKSKRAKMSDGARNREKKVPVVSLVPKFEPELSSGSGSVICDKDKPSVPIAAVSSEQTVRLETSVTESSGSNCKLVCDENGNDSLLTAQSGFPHQNLYKTSLCDSQSTDKQLPKHCKTLNKLTSGSSNDFINLLDSKTYSADSTSSVNSLSTKRRKSSDECVNNADKRLCRQNSLNLCTNSLDSPCKKQSQYSTCGNDYSIGRNSATFPPLQEVNANTVSLSHTGEKCAPLCNNSPLPNTSNVDPIKPNPMANKLPIPRLSNPNKNKQLANVIIFPPATAATILQQSQPPQKKKYKPIQPKPLEDEAKKEMLETSCETVSGKRPDDLAAGVANCDKGIRVDKNESTNQYSTEISQESFSDATAKTAHTIEAVKNGTNEESIRCLENDALLTDYFHGGNNSQEQEEELIKYFQHQNSSSSNEEVEEVLRQNLQTPEESPNAASKCDQLSQLRLLLERNLKPIRSHSTSANRYADRDGNKVNFSAPSAAVSSTPSVDHTGSTEGNLPNSCTTKELVMTASKSLSLLSRRSQQHSRAGSKPNLTLPSLTSTNPSCNLATRRRVSFETSVMEHAVPQSPNTRSFTPISPGPYSPVAIPRNCKSSSANASPFVSPRNTPVLRSKHNCSQGSNLQPYSYVVASNGPRCRHPVPAKIVRSNSVNSHNISSRCRLSHPQANTFAIPDSFPFESTGFKQNQTSAKVLPPMLPLSISAPQSPMLHYQHLNVRNCKGASDMLTTYGESLLKEAAKGCHVTPNEGLGNCNGVPSNVGVIPLYPVDTLSQEVSQIFQDASSDQKNIEALLAALPSSSQMSYRSQSVPLHRMMSGSSLVSPQFTQSSPLYPGQQQTFTFNSLSSATSSVAPTPVPSEFMDFTGLGETEAESEETEGINTESLAQILNILNSSTVQKVVDSASLTIGVGEDVEGENFALHNQQRNSYSSRSYPNTPVPYKNSSNRDPLVSSFNLNLDDNFGMMSRSYPSTPLLNGSFMSGDEIGPYQNVTEGTGSNLLNTQHEHGGLPTSSGRRNANLMSSFCVDELQLDTLDDFQACDPLSQLVREVQHVGEQTDAD
ncbi:hypothetical protein PR048_030681 [Dryococelus australis]|uniref:Uncharacterized protein n=1 Tax=Dryococelus australis TaxID=614101 RepID=A0ABQ9G9L6_9NEOP|nr:hypothetical protein PR048_030681 [Dryococelus australis]